MKTTRLLAGSMALAALSSAARPQAIAGTVRADASDPKAMIGQLQAAFEEFKKTNDEKLKAKADVVLDEKVQKLDAAIDGFQTTIDELNAKIAAGAASQNAPRDAEYSSAFQSHFRKGSVEASLNKGADDEGGYLAPIEWDRTITDKLIEVSPMRQIATVQTISGAGLKKLYNLHGTGSGWVGEMTARPETTTPEFGAQTFVPGELYANPAATQQLLDDAEVNLEAWLADEVEAEFAYQEGVAFVSGNGTNKPKGFLTYVTGAANAADNPLGAIEVTAAASAAGLTTDELIDLVYSLPGVLAQNARFVTNRNTLSRVRKLKDAEGNYIWQPSVQAGQPQQLLGHPVTEMAAMPNVAASAVPIAFGDFRRGYLIVDRTGVRVLRDPYTNKPYVMFYTTKRVGGGVKDPQAIKALRMAAA
ncbi:phage major capsid protein [Brevundimonas sp.]|uniref:phage major capsid protein n=1 Tax=Brevundimonas sp. TaxID=1871086 RepID=UPI00289CE0A0|nr:phage major capsid protein [Brevundimonas sp.]